jgi:hypothetical protein
MNQCKTCQFFVPDVIQGSLKHPKGWCKCHAPILLDRLVERYSRGGMEGLDLAVKCSIYPAVDAADGCGEHREVSRGKAK